MAIAIKVIGIKGKSITIGTLINRLILNLKSCYLLLLLLLCSILLG